jgi:hypothetical protein
MRSTWRGRTPSLLRPIPLKRPNASSVCEGIAFWEVALSDLHLLIRPVADCTRAAFGTGGCRLWHKGSLVVLRLLLPGSLF